MFSWEFLLRNSPARGQVLQYDSAAKPPGFEIEKTWKKLSWAAGEEISQISFWKLKRIRIESFSGGIKVISPAL
jgi:hypothetical protein